MSRSERDLVTALRDELAAIDPSRPCDVVAEVDGLGPEPTGREASVARLAHRLRRSGEGTVGGVGFTWVTAGEHCRVAWLRGRFLSRGSLSLAAAGPTSSSSSSRTRRRGSPPGWRPSASRCHGGSGADAAS